MKLSDIGEFALIDQIQMELNQELPESVIGIGDDAAVVPLNENESLIMTKDALIEGTHFLTDKVNPEDLGYKSIMANVSDIAAMGGKAEHAMIALGLPSDTDIDWIQGFYKGIKESCEEASVLLLGGDTTKSETIVITVTVIGKGGRDSIKLRSTAKSGDIVCVTGVLGDSLAGFECVMEGVKSPELIQRHNRPRAQIEVGQFLAKSPHVHAMMDLSDGLDSDLRHIMKASKIGSKIELTRIPTSIELDAYCEGKEHEPYTYAISSGEEYQLLFTMDAAYYPELSTRYKETFGKSFYGIGAMIESEDDLQYFLNDKPLVPEIRTYEHF